MMRLAGVLARQDHELVVWAPEGWRAQVQRLGARFEPSSPEMPRAPDHVPFDAFASLVEHETERLVPALHAHDVDLVIRDSQTPWALVAAQYLGIPRLVSHPMFPMAGATEARELGPAQRERFERSWLSIARRWGVELSDVRGLAHATSEPTLLFTTEEIVGDRELPGVWRCIGPLLDAVPRRGPESAAPLVYASFGTAQNQRTELFRLVVAALAGQRVRVTVSAGGRALTTDDIGSVPPNITVHAFVDARDVLAGASVQITHGGCNSVHESLIAGVPLVCLPQAFDQIPLSARVQELGVGVVAAEDPDAVARAVTTVLGDEGFRVRTDALAKRLRRYDGEARVAAAIAACA